MTALGFLFWMAAVFFALFLLTREERKRVEECEGLTLLLRHLRGQVAAYSLPREEIYATFRHAALEKCGFLPLLREQGLSVALSAGKLSLGRETLRPLFLFVEGEGRRLREEELAALALALENMEYASAECRRRMPERLRLLRTLLLTGGMMVAILLL